MRHSIYSLVLVSCASTVLAQTPTAGSREDRAVTMRILVDPDTTLPDEIVRKIPPPKPKRPGGAADVSAKDLENPAAIAV